MHTHMPDLKRSTWFLPADRLSGRELDAQVERAAADGVVDALLRTWGGALAILNAQRQIVAVNGAYLKTIGSTDPSDALGLRPGESLQCAHAEHAPGGCGTSRACATCGTAAAIVAATASGQPEERDCALALRHDGVERYYELRVRAIPLEVAGEPLTVLTFRDVSVEQRRAALERAFFHDLANLASSLGAAAHALPEAVRPEDAAAIEDVRTLTDRLCRELQMQRAVVSDRVAALHGAFRQVDLAHVVDLADRLFRHHPAATGKVLVVTMDRPAPVIDTDADLLQRVLTNLLLNAFEATLPGGEVRLTVEPSGDFAALRVWSAEAIPAAVLPRIFQRYFTTKPGDGRGQGTYVARLFTEQFLHGTISVTSTAEGGTAFEVRLPRTLRH